MCAVSPPMYSIRTNASSAGMFRPETAMKGKTPMNSSIQAHSTHALPGPQDIVRVQLKNGITVLVRENFTSPSVVVDGLMYGGSLWEPAELSGLANFHSDLLTRGTQRHDFDALYEEVESIGASFDVSAGGHT